MSYLTQNIGYNSPYKSSKSTVNLKPQEQQQPVTVKKNYAEVSPQKIQDSDLWKYRTIELENTVIQLTTELETSNFKAKKAKELESRIEMILKQNSQLLGEQDIMSKQFNQKKTESEIWKSKYDNQMNTMIFLKATQEVELQKINAQQVKLKEENKQLLEQKHNEIECVKNTNFEQNNNKLASIKQGHSSNTQLYEEQIRKLHEVILQREKDIEHLNQKIIKNKSESEAESKRLQESNDKHRATIHQREIEFLQQIEQQRGEQDQTYVDQVCCLKKLHQNELDTLESELQKLRDLIAQKNLEIQTLINQNKIQSTDFDRFNQDLRSQIENLKRRLIDHGDHKDEQQNEMKEKLVALHIADVENLKIQNEDTFNTLQKEIDNLKQLNLTKGQQLDNQIQEKLLQKQNFQLENDRLLSEIEDLKYQLQCYQKQNEKLSKETTQHLQKSNHTYDKFHDQIINQNKFLENQINILQQQLVKKNNEINDNNTKNNKIKKNLEEEIKVLNNLNNQLKKNITELECDKDRTIEENLQRYQVLEVNYKNQVRKLESQIADLTNEIINFKEQLAHKNEDNFNNIKQIAANDSAIIYLKEDIEKLENQVIYLEKLKAKELDEQKMRIEQSNSFKIITLNITNQNSINMLNDYIEQQKLIIQRKDEELAEMNKKYDKLEESFQNLHDSQGRLADYEQKVQLLGADIVCTKNLYDVFVQARSRFHNVQ